MCVVSMVMDDYTDRWKRYIPTPVPVPFTPFVPSIPYIPPQPVRPITQEEVDDFRRLLERATEYDRRNNEPACESADKKRVLKDLATLLGIDVSFIDEA